MKRKKLIPLNKLKKLMDKEWSRVVRKVNPKCLVCGRTDNLAAHHVIVKKNQSLTTRWLINNGTALCYRDHMLHVHGNQADYIWWKDYLALVEKSYANDVIPHILELSKAEINPNRKWLEGVYEHLKSL